MLKSNKYGSFNGVPVTNQKNQVLPYAHYRDDRFREARLVFTDGNKPQDGAYSDRLQGWDYKAWKRGHEAAQQSNFSPKTAGWFEVLLCAYYERPLVINEVHTGFNLSNGYDYYYLAWSFVDQVANRKEDN